MKCSFWNTVGLEMGLFQIVAEEKSWEFCWRWLLTSMTQLKGQIWPHQYSVNFLVTTIAYCGTILTKLLRDLNKLLWFFQDLNTVIFVSLIANYSLHLSNNMENWSHETWNMKFCLLLALVSGERSKIFYLSDWMAEVNRLTPGLRKKA